MSANNQRMISAVLLALCLCGGDVLAATVDWAAVQGLAPGDRIEVDLLTGKIVTGTVDHVGSASVFVPSGGKVVEVPSANIGQLYKKKESGWRRQR